MGRPELIDNADSALDVLKSALFEDDKAGRSIGGDAAAWNTFTAHVEAQADVSAESYATAEDYDFSRPLDVWRHSEHRQVLKTIRTIMVGIGLYPTGNQSTLQLIRIDDRRGGYPITTTVPRKTDLEKYRNHVRRVLLDLALSRYGADGELLPRPLWLGLHLHQDEYEKEDSRYNRIRFAYRPMVKALGLLEHHGLIRLRRGFRDRRTGVGRITRIRCTPKLYRLLAGIHPFTVEIDPEFETIRLQHVEKETTFVKIDGAVKRKAARVRNLINYTDEECPEAAVMREFVADINQRLGRVVVGLPDATPPEALAYLHSARRSINTHRTTLYRVFSEDFNFNGRFHGAWWQELPSHDVFDNDTGEQIKWNVRKWLTIAGLPTVELDYSSVHAVLLYDAAGKLGELRSDPYTVPGYEHHRDQFKLIFQMLVNTTSLPAARAACREADGLGKEYMPLVDVLYQHHAPIHDHLLRNTGTLLMRGDSRLAENVMRSLWSRNIPCLPVHDSFIVPAEYRTLLESVMYSELGMYGIDWKTLPFPAVK